MAIIPIFLEVSRFFELPRHIFVGLFDSEIVDLNIAPHPTPPTPPPLSLTLALTTTPHQHNTMQTFACLLLTVQIVGVFSACDDSTVWFKSSSTSKTCDWVAGNSQKRCDVKGLTDGTSGDQITAAEACPVACDLCTDDAVIAMRCVDDAGWQKKNAPNLGCDWVLEKIEKRCGKVGYIDGDESTKILAEDSCVAACTGCLFPSPTYSPTYKPTMLRGYTPTSASERIDDEAANSGDDDEDEDEGEDDSEDEDEGEDEEDDEAEDTGEDEDEDEDMSEDDGN